MTGQTVARYPHAKPTAARVGGTLLLTGGLMAVVLMAVGPGFVHGKTEPTLVIASIAVTVGSLCAARPHLIAGWFLPVIGPFGTVLIGLSSVLTGTANDGSELLYMWTVLYSAYFLPLRQAMFSVVLIAAVYPPIAISVLGRLGITPSVYLVGTSIVTLVIVSSLRRQISRMFEASALEARTDKLTELANRRSWEERMAQELDRQARSERPLCVLMVDLDHFKRLNDTFGHAAGDAALTNVAAILRGLARQSDVLARVGGEEFALLLPDCALADAETRADGIRAAVETGSAGWQTPVTVSIGLATLPLHATTGEDLMHAADVALYEAKRAGRNTVRAYRTEGPPPLPVQPLSAKGDPVG
jgi:diguanylate cyclase (GGDEF)-like protein